MAEEREKGFVTTHPLEGMWLLYGMSSAQEVVPLRSIMTLGDLSVALAITMSSGKEVDEDYFHHRLLVESRLKQHAQARGVTVETDHPLYFRLIPYPRLREYQGYRYVNLPAKVVPATMMTLTFDDSFGNYETPTDTSDTPRLLTPDEMRQHIDTEGFPQHLDGNTPGRYIECQVWTHELPVFEEVRMHLGHSANETVTTWPI